MAKGKTHLSIRIDLPTGRRFGPGKAALLHAIEAEGSISGAARHLGMSYPRALGLVEDMNAQFTEALVLTFQGGAKRGGAELTDTGRVVMAEYAAISSEAEVANRDRLQALSKLAK